MLTMEMVDQPMLRATLIRWIDASHGVIECPVGDMTPIELFACGFILNETEEFIVVGVEETTDEAPSAVGRCWVCIPKGMIIARTDMSLPLPKKIRRKR